MRESGRLHSLDAVRAFALLAGVVLHVSWPFLPGLTDTAWPLADNSPSIGLGVLFYTIHNFRMPLFFVIAGFFARALLHRRGVRSFVRNRVLRILVPLVLAWIVLYPFILAAFAWPSMKANGFALPAAPSFFNSRWSFPLAHLWFLYYLLLMYATALTARWMVIHLLDRAGRWRDRLDCSTPGVIRPWRGPLLLALLPACSLFLNAEWIRWFGVATPDTSLRPTIPAAVTFGTAFSLGWFVNRQTALLHHWECRWRTHLVAAVMLTLVSLTMTGLAPAFAPARHDAWTLAYAIIYMTASWSWTFAILGLSMRYCSQPSGWRRYLADASYWMYLVHLPIVLLLQAAMQDLPWHWSAKVSINMSVTLMVSFWSYHNLVRFGALGLLLNGRRFARQPSHAAIAAVELSQ